MVREKKAVFLTKIESLDKGNDVKILDPATTALVQDTANSFGQSLLYFESLLRLATASDQRIHIAHRAAMDLVPYQLNPTP